MLLQLLLERWRGTFWADEVRKGIPGSGNSANKGLGQAADGAGSGL